MIDVTILILIDGFLQYMYTTQLILKQARHNPYFNRWFSAISNKLLRIKKIICHNPYFNRWFSAIRSERCSF